MLSDRNSSKDSFHSRRRCIAPGRIYDNGYQLSLLKLLFIVNNDLPPPIVKKRYKETASGRERSLRCYVWLLSVVLLGCLVDEVEELVELGSDDDFGAAVALASDLGAVVGDGVVFAATAGCHARRIHAEVVLKNADNRCGAESGKIPVVLEVLARHQAYVVGIAPYEDIIVAVVLDNLGDFAKCLHSAFVNLVAARFEEHVVGKRDVNNTFEHLDIDFIGLRRRERTREVRHEGEVERVGLALGIHELLDILVLRH